jgi:hypothetical protein
MSFTESNTVEQMILDAATSLGSGAGSSLLREDSPAGSSQINRLRMNYEGRWP